MNSNPNNYNEPQPKPFQKQLASQEWLYPALFQVDDPGIPCATTKELF